MDFLTQLRASVAQKITERQARQGDLDAVLATPATEARDLNSVEAAKFAEIRADLERLDGELADMTARADALDAEKRQREAQAAQLAQLNIEPRSLDPQLRGVKGERTYRKGGDHSFLSDLFASQVLNERSAGERIARHMHEESIERRDIGVSAMAGAVPPQYLLDAFAPLARAGRPFLNSLNSQPLPADGVSFIIPRGTTGAAGAMTAEAAGFNEQDMANTDLTSTVNLVTAQQDISRTLFMRGGAVVDNIIFPDLVAAAEVALDVSAINGSGTAPQHRGILNVASINAVTYTDASPAVGEIWPKLHDAIQRINANRFAPATVIYMHPRRWGWFLSAVDTTGRPVVESAQQAPQNVMGLGVAAQYGQVVGSIAGLPVVTDANIPTNLGAGTNEDIIIVARASDVLLWEGETMSFSFEQTLSTAPGQVRLAVGRFSLFAPGRYPSAISTVGGTGLVAPTF
jgi:HK97 family phage major capsid protein